MKLNKNIKILMKDGNMLSTTMSHPTGCYEIDNKVVDEELTLIGISYQGQGATFKFKNSEGKIRYMSHSEFDDMIRKYPITISGKFCFTKHGKRQSLKVMEE